MDAKTITKTRLPSRHVTVGPQRAPHRSFLYAMGLSQAQINQPLVGVASRGNEAAPCNIALMRQPRPDSVELTMWGHCHDALVGAHLGGPIGLLKDDHIDAEEGRLDANVTVEELSRRKKDWKPREHGYGAGARWKYAQQVGPAVSGATTHPGGSHEGVCYADI